MLILSGTVGGFLAACGKRRPPVPPSRTSKAVDSLSVRQQGNRIVLTVTVPDIKAVKQINIYRLNEAPSAPVFLSADEYSSRSTLIGAISDLSKAATNSTAYYTDTLSNAAEKNRLRYAIRFIYTEGRRSALSNFLIIEPNFQIANPPVFSAIAIEQTALKLSWQKPATNLDETSPSNVAGYHIYRTVIKSDSDDNSVSGGLPELLNSDLVTETVFADTKFSFKTNYQYFVRAVTISGDNGLIESLDSNRLTVTPRDVFPPLAPQNLTIAAAPNRLSLFFAANSEPDIAGYLVFRTSLEKTPLAEWQKLTQTPLTTTTFQDDTVESNQKYYYYLQAVDVAGNVSQPSEIVAETAP